MSGMTEVKVADLTGAALDYAVEIAIHGVKPTAKHAFACQYQNEDRKDYSSNWRDGGPLIDKYNPWLSPPTDDPDPEEPFGWDADIYGEDGSEIVGKSIGCKTALIAVCRAIVNMQLGETIELPSRLFQ